MDEVYTRLMSDRDYYDIAKFVEELYLMECDLIILMARKFFTLFLAFQELNRKKYKELGIEYDNKKKIITNVSLPLYEEAIKKGDYKSIVIADDIIIHGRSVSDIYERLKTLNSKSDVYIWSYLRNDEEKIFYDKIIDRFKARYLVESDYWKMISTKIVDSFYISGRPYISYLPYFMIKGSWKDLLEKLAPQDCYQISNEVMRYHSVEGLLYTGKEIDLFRKQEYCKICGVRHYNYKKISKIVAIPYFCMDVISNDTFFDLSNTLRNNEFSKEYLKLVAVNNGADNMRLVEIEYSLSYWMAMLMIDRLSICVDEWNYDVEEYSFLPEFISHDCCNESEIHEKLDKLNNGIKRAIARPECLTDNKDIALLVGRYRALREKYKEIYAKWNELNSWNDEKFPLQKRFLEELLFVNGKIDEKRLRSQEKVAKKAGTDSPDFQDVLKELRDGNGTEHGKWLLAGQNKQKRLLGIPMTYLLQDMGEFFMETEKGKDSLESYEYQTFANVLTITDSGKGSVMARIVKNRQASDLGYHESLLHAGEQNYVFFDNTYFPYMYALYLIEQSVSVEHEKRIKNIFIIKFSDYLKRHSIYYDREELQQLAETEISSQYGKYLQYVYFRYKDNIVVQDAIDMALLAIAAINENGIYY